MLQVVAALRLAEAVRQTGAEARGTAAIATRNPIAPPQGYDAPSQNLGQNVAVSAARIG
jgi:hypothetical protein